MKRLTTKPLLEQDIERVGAQLDRDSRILNQMLNDDGLSLTRGRTRRTCLTRSCMRSAQLASQR